MNNNSNLVQYLTVMLAMLSVGVPVTIGLALILFAGAAGVFALLLISIVLTSAPIVGITEGAISYIMSGLPSPALFFFGLGFIGITVIAFLGYIHFARSILGFIKYMFESIPKRRIT